MTLAPAEEARCGCPRSGVVRPGLHARRATARSPRFPDQGRPSHIRDGRPEIEPMAPLAAPQFLPDVAINTHLRGQDTIRVLKHAEDFHCFIYGFVAVARTVAVRIASLL